jgi:TolB protein
MINIQMMDFRGLMRHLRAMFFLFVLLSLFCKTAIAAQPEEKIGFVANVNGNWDLFVVDSDGQNLVQLTNTPYDESEPKWSPDKKQIVYSTSDGQLYIIDIETKKEYQLAIGDNNDKKTSPCFSPNGKKIVYVYFKPGKPDDTELDIFDLESKTSRKFLDQYSPQFFPKWSPDDKYIVYTNVHCSSECGRIIQELWLADINGNYARQLLMTNSHCMQPVWSPDGKKITFASDKSGNFDIWSLSLDDGNVEQLTTDPNLNVSPAWSPDGQRIAFISTQTGKMKIWIKDLGNGKLNMLSPFKDKDVECRDIAW